MNRFFNRLVENKPQNPRGRRFCFPYRKPPTISFRLIASAVFVCGLLQAATAADVSTTISRTATPPVLDGRLDDKTWRNIEPVTGFLEYYPTEGAAPPEATELYIVYDKSNFYVAFRCFDSRPSEIRATLTPRDGWENDDCVGFAIDTYNTAREGYLFNINPYGIPSDFIWHHDGYMDSGWDSEIRTAGTIDEYGYSIEAAVPFNSLRMPNSEEQVWRFYALRNIKRHGAMYVWPPRTREIQNLLAQGAELRGISGIEPARNMVFIPYIFAADSRNVEEDPRNLDTGFDMRLGLSSSILLDLAVNPDYSQIEADADRIELRKIRTAAARETTIFHRGNRHFRDKPVSPLHESYCQPRCGAEGHWKGGNVQVRPALGGRRQSG